MAGDRAELEELRRLDELERKAAGGAKPPASTISEPLSEYPLGTKSFFPTREEMKGITEKYMLRGGTPEEVARQTAERIGGKFEPETAAEPKGFAAIPEAAGFGAAAGAAAPEIATVVGRGAQTLGRALKLAPGIVGRAGTPVELFGRGMVEAAPSLRGLGTRAGAAATGAIGGALGEAGGQAVEMLGGPWYAAEAARIGGATVPTTVIGGITRYVSPRISNVLNALDKFTKGETETAKALSEKERQQIQGMLDQLRGTQPESEAAQRLYGQLEKYVSDIETKTGKRISALEAGIPRIEAAGQRAAAGAQAELQRIGDISQKPSDIGEKGRQAIVAKMTAGEEARSAEYTAQKQKRDAIVAAKEQAGDYVENTKEYKELLKDINNKLLIGKEALRQRTAPVTEAGVLNAYERIRSALLAKEVPVSTQMASALKAKGLQVVERTNEAGEKVYYRRFPTAFEALDDVRRKLGAAAGFGEAAEGYEALQKNIAKQLYGKISDIQSRFAGKEHDILQANYEAASRLLDKYKGVVGKKYTAIDLDDPTRFKRDPAALVSQAFGSRQGVDDLIRLTESPDLAKTLAKDYVASSLAGKDAKAVSSWLANKKNSDFLSHPLLTDLKNSVQAYEKTLKSVQEGALRGKEAAKTIERRVGELEKTAEQTASEILGRGYPVATIKELITSGDRVKWNEVASIIGRTSKGKQDILNATREVIAEKAATSPRSAVTLFKENIAPSLEVAGIPKASIDSLTSELTRIATFKMPQQQKLTALQNVLNVFVRQYAIPQAGLGAF